MWNTVRPFITNKGIIADENVKIKAAENQNIKINKKANCFLLQQMTVLKAKVYLLKCSIILCK